MMSMMAGSTLMKAHSFLKEGHMAHKADKEQKQVRGFQESVSRRSILALVPAAVFYRSMRFAQALDPAKTSEEKFIKVRALPLNSVRLTGGPLKTSQDL